MVSQTKFSEEAIICSLDVCRAAFRIRPEDGAELALQSWALDIAHELKVDLFKSQKNCVSQGHFLLAGYAREMGRPKAVLGMSRRD